ncbi:MAG: YigZ family protein, partial [Ignavibacteriales bacterium]|nr:YigZ family protein [Ignavibacteriales bacterium]
MVTSFFTISEKAEFRLKEKGSLFTGIAFPVRNVQECDEILAQHRKDFYDATHVCYAYRIINGPVKYSDDGEPAGTAGVRLLNAIEHFNYYNILVLSIRYFGGTKLGVGPLGKAYY